MEKTCLVKISHPMMGEIIMGNYLAPTPQRAQSGVLNLLKAHKMPEENITYETGGGYSITLKGGAVISFHPIQLISQWEHIVPLLIAK